MPPMRHSLLAGGAVIALWAGVAAGVVSLAPLRAAMAREGGAASAITLAASPAAAPPATLAKPTSAAGDPWSASVPMKRGALIEASETPEIGPVADGDGAPAGGDHSDQDDGVASGADDDKATDPAAGILPGPPGRQSVDAPPASASPGGSWRHRPAIFDAPDGSAALGSASNGLPSDDPPPST